MHPETTSTPAERTTAHLELRCFGQLVEKMGWSQHRLPLVADTDTLRAQLLAQYPTLQGISFTVAVNRNITHGNTPLNAGDEIALMPPFSGG